MKLEWRMLTRVVGLIIAAATAASAQPIIRPWPLSPWQTLRDTTHVTPVLTGSIFRCAAINVSQKAQNLRITIFRALGDVKLAPPSALVAIPPGASVVIGPYSNNPPEVSIIVYCRVDVFATDDPQPVRVELHALNADGILLGVVEGH